MIEIRNFTNSSKAEIIKKKAERVLKKEGIKDYSLSIVITGEKRMRRINREYRGIDKVTDVLSFSLGDKEGEIIICPNTSEDLERVIIHGVLHLLGYDHKEKKEEEIMKERENYYLKK